MRLVAAGHGSGGETLREALLAWAKAEAAPADAPNPFGVAELSDPRALADLFGNWLATWRVQGSDVSGLGTGGIKFIHYLFPDSDSTTAKFGWTAEQRAALEAHLAGVGTGETEDAGTEDAGAGDSWAARAAARLEQHNDALARAEALREEAERLRAAIADTAPATIERREALDAYDKALDAYNSAVKAADQIWKRYQEARDQAAAEADAAAATGRSPSASELMTKGGLNTLDLQEARDEWGKRIDRETLARDRARDELETMEANNARIAELRNANAREKALGGTPRVLRADGGGPLRAQAGEVARPRGCGRARGPSAIRAP